MQVNVETQARRFYRATKNQKTGAHEWIECVGHGFTIGKYEFFITIKELYFVTELNVTEVTTGMQITNRRVGIKEFLQIKTVYKYLELATKEAEKIAEYIKSNKAKFKETVEKNRMEINENFCTRPKTRYVEVGE